MDKAPESVVKPKEPVKKTTTKGPERIGFEHVSKLFKDIPHFLSPNKQNVYENLLFGGIFKKISIDGNNPSGKKFDRGIFIAFPQLILLVSRLVSTSQDKKTQLTLDYHSELFVPQDKNVFALFSNLTGTCDLDQGKTLTEPKNYEIFHENEFTARFEQLMHGKVYKLVESTDDTVTICISFGGLLMMLEGDQEDLQLLKPGYYVYLGIAKTTDPTVQVKAERAQ